MTTVSTLKGRPTVVSIVDGRLSSLIESLTRFTARWNETPSNRKYRNKRAADRRMSVLERKMPTTSRLTPSQAMRRPVGASSKIHSPCLKWSLRDGRVFQNTANNGFRRKFLTSSGS